MSSAASREVPRTPSIELFTQFEVDTYVRPTSDKNKGFFSNLAKTLGKKRTDETDALVVSKITKNVKIIKDYLTKTKSEKTPLRKNEYEYILAVLGNMESANREARSKHGDEQTWQGGAPNLDLELMRVGQDSFQVYLDTLIADSEKRLASENHSDISAGLSSLHQFSNQHTLRGWDNILKMTQTKLNLLGKYENTFINAQSKYMDGDNLRSLRENVKRDIDQLSELYKSDPQPQKKEVVNALLERYYKLWD